jgi:NTP pyrophosphatase (non-canonical NTP hydrolase)
LKIAILEGGAPSFQEFSRRNRCRCEAPNGFNQPLHMWDRSDWFLAVIGEMGEAANIAKKLNRVRDGHGQQNKETPDELRVKFRKELGDALVYLDLLAQSEGFDLLDAAIEVFEAKSKQIGYVEPPHLPED